MADDLPTDYDVIVLGTGLSESILAAAFARIGLKVLHLDRYEYYSGDWASFTFDCLQKWIENVHSTHESAVRDDSDLLKDGESFIGLEPYSNTITNVEQSWFIRESLPVELDTEAPGSVQDDGTTDSGSGVGTEGSPEEKPADKEKGVAVGDVSPLPAPEAKDVISEVVSKEWTAEKIRGSSRKFNIDLSPKLLYCRGSLVELLISSDIAKYCEFKVISRVLTWMNEKLEPVPCSRADVFATKAVSMIEKRVLMKYLQFSLDYESHPGEYQGFEDRPFSEFLKSRKMSANVQHYVIHAIAMVSEDTPTLEALKATHKFLMSLGRYGNTAFLWPMYGSGELPQSFCRMCAVFGGVYYLRRPIEQLVINEDKKAVGVVSAGRRLNANYVVMDASFASSQLAPGITSSRCVSRAIYLTNKSILDCGKDELTLLRLPSTPDSPEPITVIELTQSACACPDNMLLVHMTCIGSGDPKKDFKRAEDKLFKPTDSSDEDDERPKVLWSLYFSRQDSTHCDLSTGDVSNVFITTSPDETLHFEKAVTQTKPIFDKICPDEEFLPKAPNPEDIIFEGGEGQAQDAGFGAQGDAAVDDKKEGGAPEGVTKDAVVDGETELDDSQPVDSVADTAVAEAESGILVESNTEIDDSVTVETDELK
ncbi:rab proteins geranylgeranyltransferase component A 2-like [Lineus longissimus]|uniref:rab proteins geranylgeranyltransferase component A 2-like n=1 Tax=Lineus longissimus TaxID=88925 RepID=UPI002B4F1413